MDKIRRKYNKWIFNKYGYNRGALFENIPIVFRICPLFSPCCYSNFEMKPVADGFLQGVIDGMKK